jgi:hypothetical protein
LRSDLVFEQHEVSRRIEARRQPGVMHEHEGQEPMALRLIGHQGHEEPPETEGLVAELAPYEGVTG